MPTYEYACKNCGNQWEEFQKISEPSTTECPKCHQASAERQISAGNFILKGGGWYADLYSSTKPSSGGDKKSDTSSAASTESKSETKSTSSETTTSTPAAATPAAAPAKTPAKSD